MASHADVKEPEVINESLIRACLTTADYLPISNEKMEVKIGRILMFYAFL
jgi:hypothetical protein